MLLTAKFIVIKLHSLVHENGGYHGMFWRTRAYFGGHQPLLTGNGVFGRRARSNPPLSAQTRQSGNSGKSLAGNGVQSTISRHCPPYPPVWELRLKLRNEFGGIPPSSATLVAVNGGREYNEYYLAERGVLWRELPSSTWRATDVLVSGSQQP